MARELFSLKYIALCILTIQNTSLVLVSRYSRVMDGRKYLVTTAVVLIESLKLFLSVLLVLRENSWQIKKTGKLLKMEIIDKYWETAKVFVPSLLYAIQNNLFFIALSYLDAATFQITYQMKVFTTAIFAVVLLRKRIEYHQWIALFILALSIILVQWPASTPEDDESEKNVDSSKRLMGLIAVSLACLSSGFSGVYFEKVLKGSDTSLWIRNIQLGFLGAFFAFCGVLGKDREIIAQYGFFQGYNSVVWSAIILQALGGLIVAAVIKYADNILKGFATSVSIVISSILSYFVLGDFHPTVLFIIGGVGVICSIFLYGAKGTAKPVQMLPTNKKENPSP